MSQKVLPSELNSCLIGLELLLCLQKYAQIKGREYFCFKICDRCERQKKTLEKHGARKQEREREKERERDIKRERERERYSVIPSVTSNVNFLSASLSLSAGN